MSDQELESRLRKLAAVEGKFLSVLLAHLAEFDSRRLAGDFGYPSLFHYCIRVLGFSEAAAYKRIHAARAARRFPALMEEVAQGRLNLAAVVVLAPRLSDENLPQLVSVARGKTIRELEAIAARLAPLPDAPDMTRALPAHPRPLSEQRYLFRFTADQALHDKYERARALSLGRPAGASMEALFDAALRSLLARIDPDCRVRRRQRVRRYASESPATALFPDFREPNRRVPSWVQEVVWRRDGGRCAFIGPDGQRCPESAKLEYDHIRPWSLGGSSDDPANIRLLCRMHNQLQARKILGDDVVDEAIRRRRGGGRGPEADDDSPRGEYGNGKGSRAKG